MKTRLGRGLCVALLLAGAAGSPAAFAEDEGFDYLSILDNGAPKWKGEGWEFQLLGRGQFDYSFGEEENAEDFDFSDVTIRRLRIGAKGKVGRDVKFKSEFNFDEDGDVTVEDLYIEYAPGGGNWAIYAGHFKTQNSFDEINSSKFQTTLERAAFTDAFQLDRRLGIAVKTQGERYTLDAGFFLTNITDDSDEDGYAIAGRGTYNPIKTDDVLVHVGASFRFRDQGDQDPLLRYRQRPYFENAERVISTGFIADKDTFIGLEALAQFQGQYWIAGEYAVTFAESDLVANDPTFDGWYIEAGAYWGGERVYKGGKFDRPTIDNPVTKGGFGAFSTTVRFDTLDLSDSGVDGGSQDTIVLAADWWPTRYTRVGINYYNSDNTLGNVDSGIGDSVAELIAAGVTDETVNGFTVRFLFDF